MEGSANESASDVERLESEIRALERRVDALERLTALFTTAPAEAPSWDAVAPASLRTVNASVFPIFGRALLGVAGAYLLRALAESGAVPQIAVVLAGILYAGVWLFFAARASTPDGMHHVIYAATAAVITAPLLWETTVRFHVLPPWTTALLLVLFVSAAAVVAWTRDLAVVTWIATVAAVGTAFALLVATHAIIPFTAALLAIAVVIEYAACRDHYLGERWVVALTANVAVFVLTQVVTRPGGVPETYPPVSARAVVALQLLLMAIYLGSTIYRTLVHKLRITVLEIVQAVIAFAVSVSGALQIARELPAGTLAIGAFCVLGGIACYTAAFLIVVHEKRRNFHAYAAFAFGLTMTGTALLFENRLVLAAAWCCVAFATALRARYATPITMRWHTAAYLLAAAAISALSPIAGAAAAVCYAMERANPPRAARAADVVIASLIALAVFAFASGAIPVMCAFVLLLPFAASRMRRPELLWLVYPTIALAGVKFVARDLPNEGAAAIAISLVVYGATLIFLPALMRRSHASEQPAAARAASASR